MLCNQIVQINIKCLFVKFPQAIFSEVFAQHKQLLDFPFFTDKNI